MAAAAASMVRRDFRAMNTDIELICYDADRRADQRLKRAERWLHAYEARLSRFLPASELTWMNRTAGRPFKASPLLFRLVELSLDLARRSGGVFDPTLLHEIEDAGYERSFDEPRPAPRPDRAARQRRSTFRDVRLDKTTHTIDLPPDLGIDLGGIGKGWSADRLASMIGSPCLVNAGGDVFAAGKPAGAEAWLAGVQDPFAPERDLAVLAVTDRGVATSSTLKRRWKAGEACLPDGQAWSHHLIDPRTGGASSSDAIAVTVVASTAALADYHAKVALLLGAERGREHLDRQDGVEGLLILNDGSTIVSHECRRYLIQPP